MASLEALGPGALAGLMEDAGSACTASQAAFDKLVAQAGRAVDEGAAARVFALLARRHSPYVEPLPDDAPQAVLASSLAALSQQGFPPQSGESGSYDLRLVMACLAPSLAALSPERLAEALDFEGFALPDAKAFLTLMACWRAATGVKPFPLSTLIQRPWKNTAGQVRLNLPFLAVCKGGLSHVVAHGSSPR